MTRRGVVLLALSILFQTASIGFGKYAAMTTPHFTAAAVLANAYYFLSLGCLGLQAVTWQLTLRQHTLSYAYSAMSLVYFNILLMSVFIFGEHISASHIAGAALVVAGVAVLTVSEQRSAA